MLNSYEFLFLSVPLLICSFSKHTAAISSLAAQIKSTLDSGVYDGFTGRLSISVYPVLTYG